MSAPENPTPPQESAFFAGIRRWGVVRGEGGMIGGVVDGLARRFGLATVPARIVTVVLALLTGGIVLVAYAAGWVLLPNSHGRIIAQDFGRGAPNIAALIGIVLLVMIGLASMDGEFRHWWWVSPDLPSELHWLPRTIFAVLVPLLVLGLIAVLVIMLVRQSSSRADIPVEPYPGSPTSTASTADNAGAAKRPSSAAPRASAATRATAADRPAPANPPVPPHRYGPYPPGPGAALTLLVFALLTLSGAAVWWMGRHDLLLASPEWTWFAVAAVILGLGVVTAGLLGRRTGFVGFLAFVFAVGWLVALVFGGRLADAFDESGSPRYHIVTDDGWGNVGIVEMASGCRSEIARTPFNAPATRVIDGNDLVHDPDSGEGQELRVPGGDVQVLIDPGTRPHVLADPETAGSELYWGRTGIHCTTDGSDQAVLRDDRDGFRVIIRLTEPGTRLTITEASHD